MEKMMKKIAVKSLALVALVGSLSGCATYVASENCPALVPVAVPVDIVTSPVQMAYALGMLYKIR